MNIVAYTTLHACTYVPLSMYQLKVFLNEDRDPMSPYGELKTNIAQLQLILLVPFVVRVMVSGLCTRRLRLGNLFELHTYQLP